MLSKIATKLMEYLKAYSALRDQITGHTKQPAQENGAEANQAKLVVIPQGRSRNICLSHLLQLNDI